MPHILAHCILLGFLIAGTVSAQDAVSPRSDARSAPASAPVATTTAPMPSGTAPAVAPAGTTLRLREEMLRPVEKAPADLSNATATAAAERKSGTLAVLASIVLPGMGELYAGRFDAGKYPLMVEGALWVGLVGVNSYGTWIQNDARTFAAQHAGVNGAGKDDQFYVNIENYSTLDEYNNAQLVQYNFNAVYPNTAEWQWSWDADANRSAYRQERIHSDEMHNAVAFFVIGMVANRIWSAIEAALFVRRYNASLETTGFVPSLRSELTSYAGRPDGLRLRLTTTF
jgi:hypothetical protein